MNGVLQDCQRGGFRMREDPGCQQCRTGGFCAGGALVARIFVVVSLLTVLSVPAWAQGLRFGNHREVRIPDDAALRLGPFYSDVSLAMQAGYRYSTSTGAGVDAVDGTRRGIIREDGSDLPIMALLTFRNYLLITRTMDLDLSVGIGYRYFPFRTQEDELFITLADEGIYGNLSSEFLISDFAKGRIWDDFMYRTDYIDTRGIVDTYGGERYAFIRNVLGASTDWMVSQYGTVNLSLSRTDLLPQTSGYEDREYIQYDERVGYEHEIFDGFFLGAGYGWTQIDYTDPDRADVDIQSFILTTRAARGIRGGIALTESSSLNLSLGASVVSTAGGQTVKDGVTGTTSDRGDSQVVIIGGVELDTEISRDLAQKISANRSVNGGFNSPYDVMDEYAYGLKYVGLALATDFRTALQIVSPGGGVENEYRNWDTLLRARHPLTERLMLEGSTEYVRRYNGQASEGVTDLASGEDYSTWDNAIGTSCEIFREVRWYVTLRRVQRFSAASALEYTRDVFETYVTYNHRF